MLRDLESAGDIVEATEQLLARAGVRGQLPTPIDDIVAAARLEEPKESILSDSALARAPSYIRDKVRALRSKVHALLDRKAREIHLNPEIDHGVRRNFKRLHEVGHDILVWQKDLVYADDDFTLAFATKLRFEREANQAGAELYLQRDLFRLMAADYEISLAAVVDLAGQFNASIHTAFHRFVETHRAPMAGLVLDTTPLSLSPLTYQRNEAIHSVTWAHQFSEPRSWPKVLRAPPHDFLVPVQSACQFDRVIRVDTMLRNLNGDDVGLYAETFSNQYKVFVLLWQPQRELFKRKRILVLNSTDRVA